MPGRCEAVENIARISIYRAIVFAKLTGGIVRGAMHGFRFPGQRAYSSAADLAKEANPVGKF